MHTTEYFNRLRIQGLAKTSPDLETDIDKWYEEVNKLKKPQRTRLRNTEVDHLPQRGKDVVTAFYGLETSAATLTSSSAKPTSSSSATPTSSSSSSSSSATATTSSSAKPTSSSSAGCASLGGHTSSRQRRHDACHKTNAGLVARACQDRSFLFSKEQLAVVHYDFEERVGLPLTALPELLRYVELRDGQAAYDRALKATEKK